MMRFLRQWLLLCCLLLSALPALAVQGSWTIPFSGMQVYAVDSPMRVEEFLAARPGLRPERYEQEPYFLKGDDRQYWVMMDLPVDSLRGAPRMLEVIDLHIEHIQAYLLLDDSLYVFPEAGFAQRADSRYILHKNFLYEIPVEAATCKQVRCLFKLSSRYQNPLFIKLRTLGYNMFYATVEYYLLGGFYGVLLLTGIYNLLLYLSTRQRVYIYFVGYIASCFMLTAGEDGINFLFLWPRWPVVNQLGYQFGRLLFLPTFFLYMRAFLGRRQADHPFLRWAQRSLGMFVLFYLLGLRIPLFDRLNVFFYVTILLLYALATWHLYKRRGSIGFFWLGFTSTLIGLTVVFVKQFQLLRIDSILFVYAFNIFLAVELLLHTVALARKYRAMALARKRAQQRIIRQLRTNERVISRKVEERTAEVQAQKAVISQQNLELEAAYRQLKQYAELVSHENEQLSEVNTALKRDIDQLATARVMMKEVDFAEFSRIFPDDERCYRYLADLKWKEGYACRRCGADSYASGAAPHARRCTKCSFDESTTNGTIFHRLHFPIQKGFYMLFLLYAHKGEVSATALSELLEMRRSTCWKFAKRVQEKMAQLSEYLGSGEEGWSSLILQEEEKNMRG